jgi:mitochondrial fission protein ELM1
MKIIKDLDEFKGGIDLWTYKQLDETKRIAPIIRDKMKQNGII